MYYIKTTINYIKTKINDYFYGTPAQQEAWKKEKQAEIDAKDAVAYHNLLVAFAKSIPGGIGNEDLMIRCMRSLPDIMIGERLIDYAHRTNYLNLNPPPVIRHRCSDDSGSNFTGADALLGFAMAN
jgi:hypothetical protein